MAESPCEKTVAIAAPITPHPSTKMQNKSKKTFKTVENSKNQNGVIAISQSPHDTCQQIIEECTRNTD